MTTIAQIADGLTEAQRIALWNALRSEHVGDDACYRIIRATFGAGEHRPNGPENKAQIASGADLSTTPSGDGWLPIESAPYDQPVRVKAGAMTFLAVLRCNTSMDLDGRPCDQWQAVNEGEHPPCWTDGACWQSNSNEVCSLQPTHFLPAPPAQGEG